MTKIDEKQKYYDFTCLLNHYVRSLLKGNSIANTLEKKNVKSVAIYGMSFLGERVVEDINSSTIVCGEYGVDIRADELDVSIPMYIPSEELPLVDLIIVTTQYLYDEIKILLHNKMPNVEIVDINSLIYNL